MNRIFLGLVLAAAMLPTSQAYAVEGAVVQSADVDQAAPLPAWLRYLITLRRYIVPIVIGILAIALIRGWSKMAAAPRMTPAERKAAEERLLDVMSEMRIRSALAGWSDESPEHAFRDEMKLIELRRIRRQGE